MSDHESEIDSKPPVSESEESRCNEDTSSESTIPHLLVPEAEYLEDNLKDTSESRTAELSEDENFSEPGDPVGASISQEFIEPSISDFKVLWGALGLGVSFAVVGVLLALKTLSIAILPHILTVGDYINFQELTDGMPIPRLLNWNLSLIQMILSTSQMGNLISIISGSILIGILLLFCVHTLNSGFRLFHFHQIQGGAVTFSRSHFRKLSLAFLCVGIPLFGVWVFTSALGSRSETLSDLRDPVNSFIWAIRLISIGIALFWGFHSSGLSGDFNRSELQFHPRYISKILLKGALFGLGVFGILKAAFPEPLDYLLVLYQTMGTFHQGYFSFVFWHFLLSVAFTSCASGITLYIIGRSSVKPFMRIGLAILTVSMVVVGSRLQTPFSAENLAAKHDMTPNTLKSVRAPYTQKIPGSGVPDGPGAGKELAAAAGLAPGSINSAQSRNVITFLQHTPVSVRQLGITEDGLSTDSSSEKKVRNFLEKRHYETALSWIAIKHLYNLGTVQFDNTTSLKALLLDLEKCPHAAQCSNTIRAMFFTCAASPQNLALLDEYASHNNFVVLDRESAKMLGDIYVRFGAVDKALNWYHKAEMPKSFIARIRTEKPMFNQGYVSGRLMWNGKPLVGVSIGAVPFRMNGLSGDLEPVLMRTFDEIIPRFSFLPFFEQFNPRPYAFRWVTAGSVTDANGRFQLKNLTQGQYILIFTLSRGTTLAVPIEPRLRVTNIPSPFDLNYDHPSADLGEISMQFQP